MTATVFLLNEAILQQIINSKGIICILFLSWVQVRMSGVSTSGVFRASGSHKNTKMLEVFGGYQIAFYSAYTAVTMQSDSFHVSAVSSIVVVIQQSLVGIS